MTSLIATHLKGEGFPHQGSILSPIQQVIIHNCCISSHQGKPSATGDKNVSSTQNLAETMCWNRLDTYSNVWANFYLDPDWQKTYFILVARDFTVCKTGSQIFVYFISSAIPVCISTGYKLSICVSAFIKFS